MNEKYGLIFNDGDDGIWMGMYKNGIIREFRTLSDFEGVYDDLALSKFAFVAVKEDDNERVWIKDICTFEIGRQRDEGEEVGITSVTEMLKDLDFPSEDSDNMFITFLTSAGKTH